MPIYTFKCEICKHEEVEGQKFDSLESFKNTLCPICHQKTLSQTFTGYGSNFVIKGYSHNNEYNGKTVYRDYAKFVKKKLNDAEA